MTPNEFKVCRAIMDELAIETGEIALTDELRNHLNLDSLEITAILIKLDIQVEDPTTLITVQDIVDQL